MNLILSYFDQQAIKKLSIDASSREKYEAMAGEVQSYELSKLLGFTFYQKIEQNISSFTDLISGCTFMDKANNVLVHKGLKYVLAYMNYAKWAGESSFNDTYTGFVKKQRQDSENLSKGEINQIQNEARQIGFNEFELIRMYLDLNKETYPLWSPFKSKKTNQPKFYGVKKTIL